MSEKRFAEENVGPVFGMTKKTSDNEKGMLKANMQVVPSSGGRRRTGSLAPIPVQVQEMVTAAAAATEASSNNTSRMYYGYNPKAAQMDNTDGNSKSSMNTSSSISRAHDLRRGSTMTNSIQKTSHLNQGQGGFFAKEDNPYVLFNQAGAHASFA